MTYSFSKAVFYLLFLSFSLIYINLTIFKNYEKGWIYADLKNYQELYYTNDHLYINNIARTNIDSIIEVMLSSRKIIPVTLQYGIYDYEKLIDTVLKKKVKLKVGLTSLDSYSTVGNKEHNLSPVNIYKSNLQVAENLPYSLSQWTTPLSYFSESDVRNVTKIFHKESLCREENTVSKIKNIVSFLSSKLEKSKGIQSFNGNPYMQYTLALSGKTKIWCTGFADIFHLFATIAGIPTRKVGFSSKMKNVYLAAHATCESYIKETNEWAFIDLNTSNIMPFSMIDNHFINAAELYNLLKYNTTNHIYTHTFNLSKIDTVSFDTSNIKNQQSLFINKEANIVYRLPVSDANYYTLLGKIKRYLGIINNVRVVYIDSTPQKNNWKHYFKLLLLLLNVITIVLFFKKIIYRLLSKTN